MIESLVLKKKREYERGEEERHLRGVRDRMAPA
jgi:hypothetical protein